MKNIILITKKEQYELNNLEEIFHNIFGPEYETLDEKAKLIQRYEMAFAVSKFYNNIPIVHTKMGTMGEKYRVEAEEYDIDNSFIIDNEITYILSLCKLNEIMLLENKDANILTKNIDKTNIEDNYIVINTYVNQILNCF